MALRIRAATQRHEHLIGIVAAITTAHRGAYAAVAPPGGGLDVTISLPVAPDAARLPTSR